MNHCLPGERHVVEPQLPRGRLYWQESPPGYQFWEAAMGGRFFSRERGRMETTPWGGRLPEEEWKKQLKFLRSSQRSTRIPATLLATSTEHHQKG